MGWWGIAAAVVVVLVGLAGLFCWVVGRWPVDGCEEL